MHRRLNLALCGATLSLLISPAAALAAPGPTVSARIEGLQRALLAPTTVHTKTGSITKGGAPQGACPATSAAGALDAATHHNWSGTYERSLGDYFVKTVLGERQTGKRFYWGIWINNRYATSGACGIKLRNGDRLLFAVDSVAHHEHPLAIRAPAHAIAGRSFKVKIVWFTDAGVAKPIVGMRITGGGQHGVTDKHGTVRLTVPHRGTLDLQAGRTGYIRAAPVRVIVTG